MSLFEGNYVYKDLHPLYEKLKRLNVRDRIEYDKDDDNSEGAKCLNF